jgi:hypothetical protein
MDQTTGHVTFRNVKVELSTDGSTWIDVSGSSSSIQIKGGERDVMEITPLFADAPVTRTGAPNPIKIAIKSVYTEVATEAREILDTAYAANTPLSLRYSITGGLPGNRRYIATNARITKPAFPDGDVSEAKPIMAEYEMVADAITKDTV